jgi:hypothetical protein
MIPEILAETVMGKDLESIGNFLKPLPILNKVVQGCSSWVPLPHEFTP